MNTSNSQTPEKTIVVALGRNSFGETFPEQKKNVSKAAQAIADLVQEDYQIVITHSNGPQIGMIQTAMTEFARLDQKYTVAPLALCSAMSQGYIGYDLQNAIRKELLDRGIFKPVSTIITQVKVDPFDPAFQNPTKVIGRRMTKEEAQAEEEKGNFVVEEDGAYRRIVASPAPMDIYEIDAIQALLDAGQIVIAAGGGGIPVLEQSTSLQGASAIIEKDYTAAKLAHMLNASTLLILTGSTPLQADGKELRNVTVEEAKELLDGEHFPTLTTYPKMESCYRFVSTGPERKGIIADVAKAREALMGYCGTCISNGNDSLQSP